MADAYTSPLSQADVLALIASTSATSFINSGVPMTVAGLMTNYPAAAGLQGQYARVSDLYGSVDDIMRCRFDGVAYRWVPQRDSYNGIIATTGNVGIVPLVTPPTVRTPGGLTGNLNIAFSSVNAYIGQRQRVVITGALGLYTATITGLIGSNLSLLGNSTKDCEFTSTGWFAVSG